MLGWIPVVKEVLGLGGTLIGGWAENKKIETETKVAIKRAHATAAIDRAAAGQAEEIQWNVKNTENAKGSWKDEFWTIVLAIPLILCFIPGMDTYVAAGFEAISNTPDWYQVAVALAISASFGYRKFADWRMKQLGGTK
jgi:hypothetical protein